MLLEFIFIILVLWVISLISIFKPSSILKLRDYMRIKGNPEYTDYAIHAVIFGGIVMFIISLVLIYFYVTEVYGSAYI